MNWEVGRWGDGEVVSSPYHPKTLSPYLLPTPDSRLLTALKRKPTLQSIEKSLPESGLREKVPLGLPFFY